MDSTPDEAPAAAPRRRAAAGKRGFVIANSKGREAEHRERHHRQRAHAPRVRRIRVATSGMAPQASAYEVSICPAGYSSHVLSE